MIQKEASRSLNRVFNFRNAFGRKVITIRTLMHSLLVILVVLLVCCKSHPSLPRSYSIPISQPLWENISRRVILVGDNHLLNIYGGPVQILRSEFADKIVRHSIRPIQLDLYGHDFLKWIIEEMRRDPFIHMGDACNFSCTGEFERFWKMMQRTKKAWVMAPGNHEGYFFGNEHRDIDSKDWTSACMNADEPMRKDVFVRWYLAALALQKRPGYQALAKRWGLEKHTDLKKATSVILEKDLNEGNWRNKTEEYSFLRSLSWKIDEERPWQSFVVQEVDLSRNEANCPPVSVIILDTLQYENAPQLVPIPPNLDAGLTGELRHDQHEIVKDWIESNTEKDRVYLLIGHHPFDSLSKKAREAVDDLRRRSEALFYVSAHTHAGQFIVHDGGNNEDNWLELNVGSILDWSLEYRTLQLARTRDDKRLVLRSPRYTMYEELLPLPINDKIWEAKPGDADYYLSHENLKSLSATQTEIRLKNTLLATFRRLICYNPTKAGDNTPWPSGCKSDKEVRAEIDRIMEDVQLDKKIKFLVELDFFEQERQVEDKDQREKYRLSQALWASKYDSVRSRKPLKDNWFIIFPPKNKKKE